MPNEIKLYGVIGEECRAIDVKRSLEAMDQTQPLIVRIHSEGGAVTDGLAMYDAFKAYAGPKKVSIESAALSIASHIAMAFDEVEITENGWLMIHSPHMGVEGDDVAHAEAATILGQLKESMINAYTSKTGKSREEVLTIMAKDTWINAKDALAQGFVSRIVQAKKAPLLAVAKTLNMPQGVFSSLFGEGSEAGELREPTKEKTMSDSKPVAASLQEIKAAFPKAKAEFVIQCLEKSLPMASVLSEALAAMDEELTATKAQLAEALAAANAKAMETEAPAEEESEEAPVEAKAKAVARTGVKPIAKAANSSKPSARDEWATKIQAKVLQGFSKDKAAIAVNRENPGLRSQMLSEVNS
jgi:ATP-dependent protease ClpP protease subunit